MMDMNSFVWVSEKQIGTLGGARFSMSATLPIANNSLTSDVQGALSGGGGFADSYYQPFILGWQKKYADVRAVYGFLAPTGRFDSTSNNNVGSGYWTHVASAGETFYLTPNKGTVVSAFQMYEFHGTQQGTHIHPGQNVDLDYSVTQVFAVKSGDAPATGTGRLRAVADNRQDRANHYADAGNRALQGQRPGLRIERDATRAKGERGR